jgi:polyphosphate kinase 2 (PPK2 family)
VTIFHRSGYNRAGVDRVMGFCTREEQTRRLKARFTDDRKTWKLTPMDLKSCRRWYDDSRARDAMFAATDTAVAPWFVAPSDDKKRVRLNIISHLLSQIPLRRPAARQAEAAQAPGRRRLPAERPRAAGDSAAVLNAPRAFIRAGPSQYGE